MCSVTRSHCQYIGYILMELSSECFCQSRVAGEQYSSCKNMSPTTFSTFLSSSLTLLSPHYHISTFCFFESWSRFFGAATSNCVFVCLFFKAFFVGFILFGWVLNTAVDPVLYAIWLMAMVWHYHIIIPAFGGGRQNKINFKRYRGEYF